MSGRDLKTFAKTIEQYASEDMTQNLHAQAHARAILIDSAAPRDQWPSFNPHLDERLYYGANLLISGGLELLESEGYAEQAEKFLTKGAEAIEFLCSSRDSLKASPREELLKAALAYHIAGRHARAYVLMDQLEKYPENENEYFGVLISILKRRLKRARRQTIRIFEKMGNNDETISTMLQKGEMSPEEAFDRLGKRSLTQAISLFLEYLKIGRKEYLNRAITITQNVVQLGKDSCDVSLWWTARMAYQIFKEIGGSSLWNCMGKFNPEGTDNFMIKRYIQSNLMKQTPIINLWPSQIKALRWILHQDKTSFGVRMPTSAGKTKIAELTILKTILDSQDDSTKCIYIAPYRSLAIEIEHTLRSGLGPLGIRVSEIYGGFDMSYADQRLINETRVLIATPEKFDAVIRQVPEIIPKIKLLIIDEGHIAGDVSERGIGAEFLLNRLLLVLPREKCRYLFISAVLPNAEDFARWIAGDKNKLVKSDWRPSRLMIGECQWNGDRIRLDYTHDTEGKFKQECFVHEFIKKQECKGLPGVGGRRNPFPHDTKEAFALSAIRFAQNGTTLAFIPQARYAEPVGNEILEALKIQSAINSQSSTACELPKPDRRSKEWKNCEEVIKDELGEESVLLKFLNASFVVHHSKLPVRVRLRTEELIRTNQVKLIVATTTLAQGVNLPIRTVLVRGLQQGQGGVVNSLVFWNIAGRAGRAMFENEGQILFFVDETVEAWHIRKLRRQIDSLIQRNDINDIVGVLYLIIKIIRDLWQKSEHHMDISSLCIKLSEDDFDWINMAERPDFIGYMSLLDQHLLALSVEANITPETLDVLQDALRKSLLFAEIGVRPIPDIDEDVATKILKSRVKSIYRRIPSHKKRQRFYKLGLSLNDCNAIETNTPVLLGLFMRASEWDIWKYDDRINFLCEIANEAMKLEAVHEGRELLFETNREIIAGWLEGKTALEIIADVEAPDYNDPSKLSKFIEDLCVYKLAWVVNSIYVYIRDRHVDSEPPLPDICGSFSAMFKYGVCDPVATVFMAYLSGNRKLSTKAALASPHKYERIDRALAWLLKSNSEDLCNSGLSQEEANKIIELRQDINIHDEQDEETSSINTFTTKKLPTTIVNVGDNVIIIPRPKESSHRYDIMSLTGEILWRIKREDEFPKWWLKIYTIEARIDSIDTLPDGRYEITILVDRMGR